MAGRMESEQKKSAFQKACENINILKVDPEKILQANHLNDILKHDEIDMSMMYKYGCPSDWVLEAHQECQMKKNKKKPKYSNECTKCWLYNLTDEINVEENRELNLNEIMTDYKTYKQFGLSAAQLKEILTFLGWEKIKDYGLFLDTIKDMKETYLKKTELF